MKEYRRRDRLLRGLGFKSYQDYLASSLWSKIRTAQLRKHDGCYACGKPATQVHHSRYSIDVLLGHSLDGLYSVCGGCHFRSEFDEDGNKRRIRKVNKALKWRRKFWDSHKVLGRALYGNRADNVDEQFRQRLEREE